MYVIYGRSIYKSDKRKHVCVLVCVGICVVMSQSNGREWVGYHYM
jgi:hypothetical protein